MDGLKSVKKLGGDAGVECVVVVQFACDKGLHDYTYGVQLDPFEDFAYHAESAEA